MENIGVHHLKVTEIYNTNLLALDIVQIIEAEANFYVRIFIIFKLIIKFILNIGNNCFR